MRRSSASPSVVVERKGGARSLRSIKLESALLDIEYEVPYQADIERCVITAGVIDGEGAPQLQYKERKTAQRLRPYARRASRR